MMTAYRSCFVVLFALCAVAPARAQDTLVSDLGVMREVRIKKITRTHILFQDRDSRGRTFKAKKDTLARIHFMNGDVHLYRFTEAERGAILESLNASALNTYGRLQAIQDHPEQQSPVTDDMERVRKLVARITGFQYTSKTFGPMLGDPDYRQGYYEIHGPDTRKQRNEPDVDAGQLAYFLLEILYLISFFTH